ncbi:MAG: B12-binding domain-containing radical SAM protein [Desulfobacca sp.]|nr:B12-binding domain-containing radical SAM protein [Desulfobacca sp.]
MKNKIPNRILLIEPQSPAEHVFSRARIPRLGTILLGTMLRGLGYEARVIIEEISGTVKAEDLSWADLVGISSITSTIPRAFHIGDQAKDQGKWVVYGGPHVSFLPEEALCHGDFVARGEGETTLIELLEALGDRSNVEEILGLSYWEEGRPTSNPARPLIQDLNTLPIPDFSLIQGWNPKQAFVPIATSRGCPYGCKFCSVVTMFGRGYRVRSIDLIMDEIRSNAAQADHLFFCDDNFAANPNRAKELLRRMKEEGGHPQWSTQIRAEAALDPEFLELLRETDCWGVYIGFESASAQVLKAYRKKQDAATMRQAIKALHRQGIHIHGMFIIGADEDTPETIRETIRFSIKNKVDSAQFMMLTPLPGTETFQSLEQDNRLLTRNWELYDGTHVVFQPRSMTAAELQKAAYAALNSFYSWRAILKRLVKMDIYYSYLRYYGRRLVKRARTRMENHRRWLLENFLDQVQKQFGPAWKLRGVRKVALFPGYATEAYQEFITSFLSRLGVEVIQADDRPEFFQALKEKVDLVVVPLLNYLQEAEKRLTPAWEQLRTGIKEKLPEGLLPIELVIDLKGESLYRACMRFGLLFSTNMKKIRRAYKKACRQLTPLSERDLIRL